MLFTSHGKHTHPPPPPTKPPQEILQEIQDLVRAMRDPDLSLS